MTKGTVAEETYKALLKKLNDKKWQLKEVQANIQELTSQIIDASAEHGVGISAKLRELLIERDLIRNEAGTLDDRVKGAYINIYESALAEAENERRNAIQAKSGGGTALYQKMVEQRNALYQNKHLSQEERDRELLALQMEVYKQKAENVLAQTRWQRATNKVNKCKMDLLNAQKEVDSWKSEFD